MAIRGRRVRFRAPCRGQRCSMRTLTLVPVLTLLCLPTHVPAAAETATPIPFFRAPALDAEGRLAEALPLYAERATATLTQGDRLRWASALLRSGRIDEGRQVLDQVANEAASVEHRPDAAEINFGVCASTALRAGF